MVTRNLRSVCSIPDNTEAGRKLQKEADFKKKKNISYVKFKNKIKLKKRVLYILLLQKKIINIVRRS